MSTAISWVFEAAIKPDGLDDYRALAREIVADNAANEPGQTCDTWGKHRRPRALMIKVNLRSLGVACLVRRMRWWPAPA